MLNLIIVIAVGLGIGVILMVITTQGDPFWFLKPKVYLYQYDGSNIVSRVHTDCNGIKWAPTHAFSMIGHVLLKEDGSCTGESNYITSWSTEKPKSVNKIAERNKRYL